MIVDSFAGIEEFQELGNSLQRPGDIQGDPRTMDLVHSHARMALKTVAEAPLLEVHFYYHSRQLVRSTGVLKPSISLPGYASGSK